MCKVQLREWDRQLEELTRRGVDAIAVRTDSRERTLRTREEWGLQNLTLGYGLSIDTAARMASLHFALYQGVRTAPLFRTEPVPDQARPDALRGADQQHAARAPAARRYPQGGRLRRREKLSDAWRGVIVEKELSSFSVINRPVASLQFTYDRTRNELE